MRSGISPGAAKPCKDCPGSDPVESIKKSATFLVQAHQGMQALYGTLATLARQEGATKDAEAYERAAQRHQQMAEWSAEVTLPDGAEVDEDDEDTLNDTNPLMATGDGSGSGPEAPEEGSGGSSGVLDGGESGSEHGGPEVPGGGRVDEEPG